MDELIKKLSSSWQEIFLKFADEPWFDQLRDFLLKVDFSQVLPAKKNIFKAFSFVEPKDIRIIILGQDPYINPNQATGLAFGVPDGVMIPPSLQNIFREVKNDYGDVHTKSDLIDWAKQGVLLLNVTLTVNQGESNSHAWLPWKTLVVNVLNELMKVNDYCAMLLWGNFAQKIFNEMKIKPAYALSSSHPSPLSYRISFANCHHFRKVNDYLKLRQNKPIVW